MTEIRAAAPGDALAVARVHVRAWQAAYRGLIAQDYLDSLVPETWANRYTFGRVGLQLPKTLLAVDGRIVRGMATTGLYRGSDLPNFGELSAIYVDPDCQSRGIGRLLIAAARQRLGGLGVAGAVLWVLEGNERARRFYERDGWVCDGTRHIEIYGGLAAHELRYQRAPV